MIQNDVARTYTGLLSRFGTFARAADHTFQLNVQGPEAKGHSNAVDFPGASQKSGQFRTLLGPTPQYAENDFPALAEVASLERKIIPNNLKFNYHLGTCKDADADLASGKPACTKFDRDAVQIQFWRSLSSADIQDFPLKVAQYNKIMGRPKSAELKAQVPSDLQMYQYLSNGNMPEDFIVIVAAPILCGNEASSAKVRWNFHTCPGYY